MNESHKHKIMIPLFKDVKRSKTVDIKSQTWVLVIFYFLTGCWIHQYIHFVNVYQTKLFIKNIEGKSIVSSSKSNINFLNYNIQVSGTLACTLCVKLPFPLIITLGNVNWPVKSSPNKNVLLRYRVKYIADSYVWIKRLTIYQREL